MDSERLIAALDVPTLKEAENLVETLKPLGITFKVGLELFYSEGPAVVKIIQSHGCKVFLDSKFHDIPNTAAGASRAAARMGVFMYNVHTSGGIEMMKCASDAAREEAHKLGKVPPKILGVTVLTSIDNTVLREQLSITKKLEDQVAFQAHLAQKAGLDGVVASPKEIGLIRKECGPNFLIVTPGIRPQDSSLDDQQRVMTPRQAAIQGADYIVVGRPITKAQDPYNSALAIVKEFEEGLKKHE